MRRLASFALVTTFVATTARAQSAASGQTGARPLLPRAKEIALARSAAPAAVSDSATVFVLTAEGYEVAVAGTNGAACYVSRDWVRAIAPHCFDAEGAQTVMPMEMRRVELLHAGRSTAEADRAIADGLAAGAFRVPTRPAVSYMLSAAQQLISDDGRAVGAWKPHLMIYYPWLSTADVGLAKDAPFAGFTVVDPGTPVANLMVVVPEFVQPRPVESAKR